MSAKPRPRALDPLEGPAAPLSHRSGSRSGTARAAYSNYRPIGVCLIRRGSMRGGAAPGAARGVFLTPPRRGLLDVWPIATEKAPERRRPGTSGALGLALSCGDRIGVAIQRQRLEET